MNTRRTMMLTGGLAALLSVACSGPTHQEYKQPTEYAQKAPEPEQTPAEPVKQPEPRQPEIKTIEEISGNYTLTPNGKPQRAGIAYRQFTRDGVAHAALSIDYFRPGTDEKKLEELSGEGYACVPAAQFSFETLPGQPEKVRSGTYQINGKNDDGGEACGDLVWWTLDDAERKEGTQLYTGKRAEDMQKLFDYTLKTIRAQQAQSEKDVMSPYLTR